MKRIIAATSLAVVTFTSGLGLAQSPESLQAGGNGNAPLTGESRRVEPQAELRGVSYRTKDLLYLRTGAFTIKGRFDEVRDGTMVVSTPLPASLRKSVSEGRQVPLASVPERTKRSVLLYNVGGEGLRGLKKMVGDEVEVTVNMDSKGFLYLLKIEPVRR